MNQLLLLLVALFLTTGKPVISKEVASCAPPAKCYGYSPCNACSDCSACAHCNAVGKCGVCRKGKTKDKVKASDKLSLQEAPVSSSQCQATTKKGSQCSRKGTEGGYCWQHKE